ncbi:hypothetical protein [Mesorhizobium sp. KR9-304]|uniref:hypothetical protein n=1 Tax=Mesorhizobium sp. KR9-304 TaxID=3156614 RepID=UPI0032B314A2
MILVVIFAVAGAIATMLGLGVLAVERPPTGVQVLASLPFFGTGILFFGVAQLIYLLVRIAAATERTAAIATELQAALAARRAGNVGQ